MQEVRPDWYHNMSSVLEAGPVVRTNQLDFDDEVIYKSTQYLYDHTRHRNGQPFCLTVAMTHPHDPYAMTKEYWDMYEGVDIPLPKIPSIPHDQQDPHSQRVLKCIDLWGRETTEERVRAARRAYFAACTYVDAQVGKLLRVLNDCGLAEHTIIVFSGDHGDMLGERGLWYKMVWYEMAARVPLLVYAPKKYEAKRVKENVSIMDLLPTFVGMAGSSTSPELPLDGKSLMPYITGEVGLKTDLVLGEYMGEGTLSPVVMIRRGRWKFVFSSIDPPQLFDLIDDPLEQTNLAAGYSVKPSLRSSKPQSRDSSYIISSSHHCDSQHLSPLSTCATLSPRTHLVSCFSIVQKPISPPRTPEVQDQQSLGSAPDDRQYKNDNDPPIKSILASFLDEVASRWDLNAITTAVLQSQRQRRLVHGALMQGIKTTWEYNPPVDASTMYIRNCGKGALDDTEWLSRWPRV